MDKVVADAKEEGEECFDRIIWRHDSNTIRNVGSW